ncbi:class I SAM-dependent methyltransferase [soil metagenome]
MARRAGGSARPGAATTLPGTISSADYHRWVNTNVVARERELTVVSKPGVPGHGGLDAATGLLLDHLEITDGESLLDLHCGPGIVGSYAARTAGSARIEMFDRNLLSVEAARRTLDANAIENANVSFGAAPASSPAARFDAATIRLPIGKLPTLHQLWTAFHHLRPGGRCYVAGANDEGIRTALRQLEVIFGNAELLGYRSGNRSGIALRPAEMPASANEHRIPWTDEALFREFIADTPAGPVRILSRPGVFSWDRVDAGSRALLDTMHIAPGESVLELGCGYGVVGIAAAMLSGTGMAALVDVDAEAVRSATRSAAANGLADRVEVHASDGSSAVGDRQFDVVVTNPPFHLEKGTNLAIPSQFIRDAARALAPGGRLYLVANRTLPYERWLEAAFGSYEVARNGKEFKVLTAVARPLQRVRKG